MRIESNLDGKKKVDKRKERNETGQNGQEVESWNEKKFKVHEEQREGRVAYMYGD